MGDLKVARTATSALTRSKGLLLIVSPVMPAGVIANYIAMAHACNSSTRVKEYWRVPSLWMVNDAGKQAKAWEAQVAPLPPYQAEIDFQNPSPQASSCYI